MLKEFKYARICSDLHLNFDVAGVKNNPDAVSSAIWKPPALPTDPETALIIAGDLWESLKFFRFHTYSWFKDICSQFMYVIVVLGNHDYYTGHIRKDVSRFRELAEEQGLSNLHLLQNSHLRFDNNLVIWGSTFWTNFNNGNAASMYYAKNGYPDKDKSFLTDFNYIRAGANYARFSPKEWITEHQKAKNSLLELTETLNGDDRLWVVSHHAPDYRSIPENRQFKEKEDLAWHKAGAYYSDLSQYILELHKTPEYWIHGHTHCASEYFIHEKTKVIVQPRGYGVKEKIPTNWSDTYLIEV